MWCCYRDAGTNGGPTVRTVRLAGSGAGSAGAALSAAGAADCGSGFFGSCLIGRPCASRGCESAFARSGVTMMSPCSIVVSLTWPRASAQLWPCRRQPHEGLNAVRYLNAFGSAEYVLPLCDTAWLMSSPGLRCDISTTSAAGQV